RQSPPGPGHSPAGGRRRPRPDDRQGPGGRADAAGLSAGAGSLSLPDAAGDQPCPVLAALAVAGACGIRPVGVTVPSPVSRAICAGCCRQHGRVAVLLLSGPRPRRGAWAAACVAAADRPVGRGGSDRVDSTLAPHLSCLAAAVLLPPAPAGAMAE